MVGKCSSKKGEAGISILILMIGSILIVGMLIGVYLFASHKLETESLKNVDKTEKFISSKVLASNIESVYDSDQKLKNMTVLLKLGPGSDGVNLNDLTISIKSEYEVATLQYRHQGDLVRDQTTGYFTSPENKSGYYTIEYLKESRNNQEGIIYDGDLVRVYFEMPRALDTEETITLTFVPQVGTSTELMFITPDTPSVGRVSLSHY